ncbi:MAG: hypothetical protein Q4D51_01295 [Eubacteriales bacterium]|nr:hypothetical protein [Eubacteriales bacterium]
MKKKNTNVFVMIVLVIVVFILGYYTYLSNQTKNKQGTTTKTEKEELLDNNFAENYPKTVREMMKTYCKYLKMAYSGGCTDEELRQLNSQMRQMLDDELLANNPADRQLNGLKTDIILYEEKKQKFIGYTLEEASQIQYNKEEGKEYAKTKVLLNFKVGTDSVTMEQEYLLRKDEMERWKIMGWQTVKPKNANK